MASKPAKPLNEGRYGVDVLLDQLLDAEVSISDQLRALLDAASGITADIRTRNGPIYQYGTTVAEGAAAAIAQLGDVDPADEAAVRFIQQRIGDYIRFAGWIRSTLGQAADEREALGLEPIEDDPVGAQQGKSRPRTRATRRSSARKGAIDA